MVLAWRGEPKIRQSRLRVPWKVKQTMKMSTCMEDVTNLSLKILSLKKIMRIVPIRACVSRGFRLFFRRCGRFAWPPRSSGALAMAVMAAVLVFAPVVSVAQEGDDNFNTEDVVARVNGVDITQGDVMVVEELYRDQLERMPVEMRRPNLVGSLIDLVLFSNAANEKKLGASADFKRRMTFLRRQALREQYLNEVVEKSITDADTRARYDEDVKAFTAEDEVRARHILVEDEDEARRIKEEIDKGGDFVEIAKTKSTGPSGAQGGDLGYFTREKMVKPFADAAFAMDVGDVSEPVQTRFGWHIIKLEDKRKTQPPSFESVSDRLRQAVYGEKLEAALAALRARATIEVLDPSAEMPQSSSQDSGQSPQ